MARSATTAPQLCTTLLAAQGSFLSPAASTTISSKAQQSPPLQQPPRHSGHLFRVVSHSGSVLHIRGATSCLVLTHLMQQQQRPTCTCSIAKYTRRHAIHRTQALHAARGDCQRGLSMCRISLATRRHRRSPKGAASSQAGCASHLLVCGAAAAHRAGLAEGVDRFAHRRTQLHHRLVLDTCSDSTSTTTSTSIISGRSWLPWTHSPETSQKDNSHYARICEQHTCTHPGLPFPLAHLPW